MMTPALCVAKGNLYLGLLESAAFIEDPLLQVFALEVVAGLLALLREGFGRPHGVPGRVKVFGVGFLGPVER